MLISILAKVDALFWPYRGADPDARRAVAELRAEYRDIGLPWRTPGDAAARTAAIRELDAMGEAGRLVVTRTPGRVAVFVKLPDAVDTELRRMATLADYAGALPLLGWIRHEISKGRCVSHGGQTWVRETDLAGVEYGQPGAGKVLGMYAEYLLPLLVRGLVDSNADGAGRVWYALTPAGDTLAADQLGPETPSLPLEPDPAARDAYLLATRADRAALDSLKPRDAGEIGPIPMPVGRAGASTQTAAGCGGEAETTGSGALRAGRRERESQNPYQEILGREC